MHFLRHRQASFKKAIEGIIWTYTSQPNFRIHVFLSLLAIILGLILQINQIEFLIILLLITIGLTTELANTSVENITDLITKEWKAEAKLAKDIAAGMMLVISIGALIIASVIFIPRFLQLL